MDELHPTVRKTVEALLRLMGFADVQVGTQSDPSGEGVVVHIEVPEASLLIGENGTHLRALEYIAKLVVRRAVPDSPRFFLDINRYRQGRIEYLRECAHEAGSRAAREHQEVVMEPMSSYERRVVHLELASRPDLTTESIGEEPERRVVVKPYP